MVCGSALDYMTGMDPRIAHVITAMERNLDGRLTVAALAEAVTLSPSRLSVLFRRETGVTPVRYLRTLRMERARLLLERTFLSVKEVMAFVGVNDPSHFTRDFSRHHGVAPSRIRQSNWAPEAWRSGAIGQGPRHIANDRSGGARTAAAVVESKDGAALNGAARHVNGESTGRPRDGQGENDR
jgi:AraC-like DNA-binding protein